MTCPVCKQEIEKGSDVCPRCGAQLRPTLSEEQLKGGWRATIALFLVAVALVGTFVGVILNWREVQQRTARIESALDETELEEGTLDEAEGREGAYVIVR